MEQNKYRALRTVDKWLYNIENAIASVFYVCMMVIVFVGVVLRYVTKTPNLYGEELSRYMMVACVYMGIAVGCRRKAHLNVELFVNLLPAGVRKIVKIIVRTFVLAVYVFMTYQGFLMILKMQQFGQVSPAMRIPLWIMYTIITVGFALSSLNEVVLYLHEFVFHGTLLEEKEAPKES